MNRLLSGTSLAALLLLAPQLAVAQTQPQAPGQNQAQRQAPAQGALPPQAVAQLQQAEQALTQAARQMGAASGPQQAKAAQGVRQALTQVQQALEQVPQAQRTSEGYRTLEGRVREAQGALQGDRPDMARARPTVEAVIAAIPVMRAEAAGSGGSGAQIVLRQAPDQVQVQQAAPQVTVQQARPEVLVVIPQPEIIVRQPPAQVTVRIPEPQVAVQQGQPQVRVEQSQPNVSVVPTEQQARVQVQQAEPRVIVQQQGQPQLRFEQTGQAQVRVEQQGREGAGAQPQAQMRPQAQGQVQTQPAAQAGAPAAGMPLQRVSELVGTNVIGANGRDAGEVENLLVDRAGNVRAAVIEWGGFLGLGQRRAVVPIEELQFTGNNDRATLNMTRQQLEQLGNYDENNLNQYSTRYGWGEGVRTYR